MSPERQQYRREPPWEAVAPRLEGKTLEPFRYRDFGSLVSLGEYSTVGNLMRFITGKGLFIGGYCAPDVPVPL